MNRPASQHLHRLCYAQQEMPPAAKEIRGNIEVPPDLLGFSLPPPRPGARPLDPCEGYCFFIGVACVCCALTKTQKAINTSLRLTVDGFLLLVWKRNKATPARSCTGAHIGAPLRWCRGCIEMQTSSAALHVWYRGCIVMPTSSAALHVWYRGCIEMQTSSATL